MSLSYITVDVFTTTRFAGNPLAIVHIPPNVNLTQAQKQQIAKEFNYSETVFVHPPNTDSSDHPTWVIDIFIPTIEIPFAGHPVIGTAVALLSSTEKSKVLTQGTFLTKAGRIPLTYDILTHQAHASIPHDIRIHAATLSDRTLATLQPTLSRYPQASPLVSIVRGMTFVLVGLESESELAEVQKTGLEVAIARDDGWDVGVVGLYFYVCLPVEATGDSEGVRRVRTRMIQRDIGEDPATGSAASALAAYLAMREPGSEVDGVVKFEVVQGVEMGRRSDISVLVKLGSELERTGEKRVEEIRLGGSSVQVMEGSLRL